ncbi:MAG: sulfate ABC transporter substrate-binding protein [Deltaproteobacteria bacterium]|jgi:sulfate transport system substrate-binding protein|nr:sulfate ABC transporter substrate-binding protein [Deltaproteobacteria bacterium]
MKKQTAYLAAGILALSFLGAFAGTAVVAQAADVELNNVSYDPTRELYDEFNAAFERRFKDTSGKSLEVVQSHGGSSKQARTVIEGNEADVVTLALAIDITEIEKAGLIKPGWQKEFPSNSAPYTSTIVFLVRNGNPKKILDWDDLVREGVGVITPNPKTSGGARWNYLAAWAFADREFNHDEAKVKDFMKDLFQHVLVLDTGARGATNTFVANGQGDVLLAWENEAYLAIAEAPGQFEIISPPLSILAEPPVAIVDTYVDKRGTREIATEYLNYLYTPEGQRMAGRHFYRPSDKTVAAEFKDQFRLQMELVTIDDPLFGGWEKAQAEHFSDGGVFDQIYAR